MSSCYQTQFQCLFSTWLTHFFIVVLRHFLNLYLYAMARWVAFSVGTFVEVRRQIEKICSSSALMILSIKFRLLELDVSRLTSRAILPAVVYWFWGMVLYNTYLLWTHCGYRDFFLLPLKWWWGWQMCDLMPYFNTYIIYWMLCSRSQKGIVFAGHIGLILKSFNVLSHQHQKR